MCSERLPLAEVQAAMARALRIERVALDRLPTPERRRELTQFIDLFLYCGLIHIIDSEAIPAHIFTMYSAFVMSDCAPGTGPTFFESLRADMVAVGLIDRVKSPWARHLIENYRRSQHV